FVKNFKNKIMLNNFSNGIFFKSLKVNQDPRFDFPVIGEKTLINIKNAKLNGLALMENKLILLNKEKLIKLADELDLFIFVVK
ncbi:MAG: UDP-2,3-diacylglucosamine diphosphatase LpxI domain-containing protein, partial [Paracoccaceae bacterium]